MINIKRWIELQILKLRNKATLDELNELAKIESVIRKSNDSSLPKT